jgi:hypothetical protein
MTSTLDAENYAASDSNESKEDMDVLSELFWKQASQI